MSLHDLWHLAFDFIPCCFTQHSGGLSESTDKKLVVVSMVARCSVREVGTGIHY